MESFLVLLYGIALIAVIAIIYDMMQLKTSNRPKEAVITVHNPTIESSQDLWPWSITKYSFWPQWFKEGFGHPGHPNDFGTEGGYGYTGRQDPRWDCSFEGDGYGKSEIGGNFARSGMLGYTGREPHPYCSTQLPVKEFKKLYKNTHTTNEFRKLYEDNTNELNKMYEDNKN
jgi:hypothetical protein